MTHQLVFTYDVECIYNARYKAQQCEDYTDEELSTTALLCPHTQGREDERQDHLTDVCACEWHG